MRNVWIHTLIVIALVTAAISPACAFVSGNSNLIEICAADGSLQTVAVPDSSGQPHKSIKKNDCGFCFAQTHMKASAATEIMVIVPPVAAYLDQGAGKFIPRTLSLHAYQSQAPPASFS